MPLVEEYRAALDSPVADLCHVNTDAHTSAGSITAALFLQRFAGETRWAHLDIAGVDLRTSSLPTVPEGFSGFGVRLLDRFVRDFRPVPAAAAGSN